MRRTFLALSVVFLLVAGAPAALAGDVTLTGAGWGHGIGMPQYGARGMAEEGSSAEQIISYFYDGTEIGTVGVGGVTPPPDPIAVGILQTKTEIYFQPVDGQLVLCLYGEANAEDPCSPRVVDPGPVYALKSLFDGTCHFTADAVPITGPGLCDAEVTWSPQPNVGVKMLANGYTYRRGSLRFRPVPNTTSFHATIDVPLEKYLYGVAEMPSDWPHEAMRAQAIASRSYAVAKSRAIGDLTVNPDRQESCWCHMYATVFDQVYAGSVKEDDPVLGPLWVAAVDTTAGMVATHDYVGGEAIQAFFSSSSGGATENNADVWNGTQRPYLISKPDPWSLLPANPYAKWDAVFSPGDLAAEFGVHEVVGFDILERFDSGSPADARIVTLTNGVPADLHFTGPELRTELGLRSGHIDAVSGITTPADDLERALSGDFNGDGRSDIVNVQGASFWVSTSGGADFDSPWAGRLNPGAAWSDHLVGDFNGDGKDDVAAYSSGEWWVGVSDGRWLTFSRWITFSTTNGWGSHVAGDFNGDGLDDLASFHPSNGTWWVSASSGSSFTTSLWADFVTPAGWEARVVGDYDADGRDDIAQYHPSNGTWWVSRSTGTSFSTARWAVFVTAGGWMARSVGDFDADGRADVAQFHPSNGTWWVSRSTGTSFTTDRWADFATDSGWEGHTVGDFDGDGDDEIAQFHPSNGRWWVSRSTGTSFATELWADFTTDSGWVERVGGDFDGNGRHDVAQFHPSNATWWAGLSTGAGFATGLWEDWPIQ